MQTTIVVWFLGGATFFGGSGVALQARLSATVLGSALGSALGGGAMAAGLPAAAPVPLSAAILLLALGVHLLLARRRGIAPVV